MVIMQVPMALHAQNRQKLLDRMRAQLEAAGRDSTNGIILLQVLSTLPITTTTSTTSLPPCLAFAFFRASCLPQIDVELSGPTLPWGSNTKTRS
jgi:high-affinity K+ transport system ATPase subunit B